MAQRVEGGKTSAALRKTSPYDELAAIHKQLAQREREQGLAP
ncbi:hypothetical protein [Streptomyces sp. WAC 06725]|nr:hypothetical protein [Streptomyces sp. WAC 06725]